MTYFMSLFELLYCSSLNRDSVPKSKQNTELICLFWILHILYTVCTSCYTYTC